MDAFYHATQLPNTSGIYRITCTSTEKIYIGSAINLRNRWQDHRKCLRRNNHINKKLQNAWNKYGEKSFAIDVLELIPLPELLIIREQYWFDTLKPFGSNGFNIAINAGSSLGLKHSPETIEKLRAIRSTQADFTPEALQKMHKRMIGNTHLLGHKHTEDTRKKMSQTQKGRTHSPETKEKIRTRRIGKTWSAEARAGASATHMGKPGTFLGKKHSDKSREKMQVAHANEMKTIIAIAPDGTEYVVHGIRQFCRDHGLYSVSLRRVAKGEQSNHKGWKARFVD